MRHNTGLNGRARTTTENVMTRRNALLYAAAIASALLAQWGTVDLASAAATVPQMPASGCVSAQGIRCTCVGTWVQFTTNDDGEPLPTPLSGGGCSVIKTYDSSTVIPQLNQAQQIAAGVTQQSPITSCQWWFHTTLTQSLCTAQAAACSSGAASAQEPGC